MSIDEGMDTIKQFYEWDVRYLAIGELSTSYLDKPWDKKSLELLKTNPIKNMLVLWKYLPHLVREAQASPKYIGVVEFSILLPEQFCQLTWRDFMAQIIYPGSPVCIPHWTLGALPARLQAHVESECKSTSCTQEGYQKRSIPVSCSQG